jgi:hypothetical protein
MLWIVLTKVCVKVSMVTVTVVYRELVLSIVHLAILSKKGTSRQEWLFCDCDIIIKAIPELENIKR